MAAVDERETVRQVGRLVASETYHKILVNVSLLIFKSGLEDLLMLQSIGVTPISHHIDPS